MKIRFLYIFLFINLFFSVFSQYNEGKKIALENLAKCGEDSNKVFYLNRLAVLNFANDFKAAYGYSSQALELSEKINYLKGKVNSLNTIGSSYWYNNNYIQALAYYYKAYKINDSIQDKRGLAESLYNIGWIKVMQQKNHKEITYLYKSLQLYKEFNDTSGLSGLYHTLGQYYGDFYTKNREKKYFDSSFAYYDKAINTVKLYGGKKRNQYVKFYGSLGDLFALSGDYNSAIFYKEKGIDFHLKNGDTVRYYGLIDDLAGFEFNLGNIDKAIAMDLQCYNYGKRTSKLDILLATSLHLNRFYNKKNDVAKAYKYLSEALILKDSLDQQLFSTNLNDIQNSYEIEKRETDISQLKQANEIQDLKAKQNKFILLGVGIVLLIIIMIAYLLFKQNKQKNAANILLKEQNSIISQKKQEIDQSIQYAKGIQMALLPDINEIKITFPESFIYYLPKDVVSGDFYWFHSIGDYFYCVAADCTGHGVPGALMSIVSMDKIIQAIFEKKITEPSDILKFLNIEIKKTLKQHNDETKQRDGLDIALVRINKKNNTVDFAAANRPLYIISDNKFTETKTDKVAIAGFTPDNYDFKQVSLKLNKGDCLYMATDGYADQFGGDNGKKYMTKNFKSLLQSVSSRDMKAQEIELIDNHTAWKGQYEQVDDILVIGIEI